jgi:hypothetical protein
MSPPRTTQKAFIRSPKILFSQVDEEVVILNMYSNDYLALNPVASRIWQLLESPLTLSELCAQLMEEYEVDQAICEAETQELLENLVAKQLIEVTTKEHTDEEVA